MTQEQRVSANEVGLLAENAERPTREAKREVWTKLDQAISASCDVETLLRVVAVAAEDDGFSQLGGAQVIGMVADRVNTMTSNLERLHAQLFRKQEATE